MFDPGPDPKPTLRSSACRGSGPRPDAAIQGRGFTVGPVYIKVGFVAWRAVIRKLGPVGLLGLLWMAFPIVLGVLLVAKLGAVAEALHQYSPVSWPVWTVFMALAIGVGLLPVYANTFLCGWVFGWAGGCLSGVLSYLGAAAIGYYLSRRLSYDRVNAVIEESEGARRVRYALVHSSPRRTLVIVSLWRLAAAPFPLSNLVMASCGVPLGIYLRGTLFGLGPRVVVGTLIAATAARSGARDIQALVGSSQHPALVVLGLLASVLILVMIGNIAMRALRKVTSEQ